jgi:type II secretory pathway pseudopilin PulG
MIKDIYLILQKDGYFNCLHKNKTLNKNHSKFTLIELLVVTAILTLLISLFTPALRSAMYQAKNLVCLNNTKHLSAATIQYCDDNADYYPTRGQNHINSSDSSRNGNKAIVTRFADYWQWRGGNPDRIYNLVDILEPYIGAGTESVIWVCPLLIGAGHNSNRGCLEHGLSEITGNYERSMSYAFYGGLGDGWAGETSSRKRYGGPDKIRIRIGDPFIRNGYSLNILWGDFGRCGGIGWNNSSKYVTSLHNSPPGVPVVGNNVYGMTPVNYAYDDGSAMTKIVHPLSHKSTASGWFKSGRSDSGSQALLPID